MKIVFAGVAAIALLATPVVAQMNRGEGARGAAMTRVMAETGIRNMFARVDGNRDGFVTQAEAQSATQARRTARQANRGERRAEKFAMMDANRDGSISRAEFDAPRAKGDRADRRANRAERRSARVERRMERRGQRGAQMARFGAKRFERMDANKDGRVSLAEATAISMQRFDRVDANRDGTITRDERRAVRAERQGRRG